MNVRAIIFIIYILINTARFITVGHFSTNINYDKANDTKYKPYACDCYFVSKNPQKYNISANNRFALASAIPTCTNCTYCETYFNAPANNSFNINRTCPVGDYVNNFGVYHFGNKDHWNKVTGCPKSTTISETLFWIKDYNGYAISTLAILIPYCSVLILSALLIIYYYYHTAIIPKEQLWGIEHAKQQLLKMIHLILKAVYVYNILISEILLYLYYKPLQYDQIAINYNDKHILCQTSSISEAKEDWLGIITFISFIGLLLRLLYTICCFNIYAYTEYACVCCSLRFGGCCHCDRDRRSMKCCNKSICHQIHESMDENESDLIHAGIQNSRLIMIKHIAIIFMVIGVISAITGFFGIAASLLSIGGDDGYGNTESRVTVFILLLLTVIDNPIIWMYVYKNIWKRQEQQSPENQLILNDRY